MPNRRKPRVVFDSVVWVSIFLRKAGLTAELLTLCLEKTTLYTAEEILTETRRVLLEKDHIRNKYVYHDAEVEHFIELIRGKCLVVSRLPELHVIERDPKDDMVIACARCSRHSRLHREPRPRPVGFERISRDKNGPARGVYSLLAHRMRVGMFQIPGKNELTLFMEGWKDGRMEYELLLPILPFFHPYRSLKCTQFSETCPFEP